MPTSKFSSAQLEDYLERNLIPRSVIPVDLSRTIPYSEFQTWDWETKMERRESLMLVCDKATWAVADMLSEDGGLLAGTTIISGDETIMGKHVRRVKFGTYIESEIGFATNDFVPLYTKNQFQEETKMAQENQDLLNISESDIDAMMEGNGAADGTNVESFNNQGAGTAGTPAAPSVDPAVAEVRKMTQKVQVSRLSKLDAFNREHGELIAYITSNDRRVMSTVPYRVTNRDNLLPSVTSQQIIDYHNQGQKSKIGGKNYPHEYVIGFRESKPGKVVSVAVEVARAGMIDPTELRNAEGMPEFDPTDTTRVKINLKFADFFNFMGFYFPYGIRESKATHGSAASDMIIEASMKKGKDSAALQEVRVLRSKTRKSNYLLPTNYFPINTFETVDLSKAVLSPEEQKGLNIAAFYTLVRPKNNTDDRFQKLDKESKDIFLPGSTPENIQTSVFAPAIGERKAITVASFHNKDQKLDVVKFPVKELVPLKDEPTKFRAVFKTINTLNADVLASQDPRASLFSPEFAAVRAALGEDILKPENLKQIIRRTGGATSGRKDLLSADELRRLQLAGAYENANIKSNIDALKDTHGLSQRLKDQLIR